MFEGLKSLPFEQKTVPFEQKTLPFEHLGWRFTEKLIIIKDDGVAVDCRRRDRALIIIW